MRKRPTAQTITFRCPICHRKQKGYSAVCPTPGCDKARWAAFVAQMKAILGY